MGHMGSYELEVMWTHMDPFVSWALLDPMGPWAGAPVSFAMVPRPDLSKNTSWNTNACPMSQKGVLLRVFVLDSNNAVQLMSQSSFGIPMKFDEVWRSSHTAPTQLLYILTKRDTVPTKFVASSHKDSQPIGQRTLP